MISGLRKKFIALFMVNILLGSMFLSIRPVQAADEYDALRAKWMTYLLGGSYDLSDPDIALEVTNITSSANASWSTLNTDPARTYLWSDLSDWTASATITSNYSRLASMATAYATNGSSLQGNQALVSDVIEAMDWLYAHHYHASQTEFDNWWDWEIGTPTKLVQLMILMYDQLSAAQFNNYLSAIDKWCPSATKRVLNDSPTPETGANLSDKAQIVILRGIVGKDGNKIAGARDALSQLFPYVEKGDGFYTDGSFIQHTNVPYNGSYGAVLLGNMARLLYLLNGSTWTVTDPDVSIVYDWVVNSYQPLIYKGGMMSMVNGRAISRQTGQEHDIGRSIIASILLLAQSAPADKSALFKSMIKAWVQADTTYTNYYTDYPEGSNQSSLPLSIYATVQLKALMNDSSVVPLGEWVKTQVFAGMDRVVHLRPGFGIGLSMFSSRIASFEITNNENLDGWWTGAGMTYLYNHDLTQYTNDYWANVDRHRLAGTTTDRTVGTPPTNANGVITGYRPKGVHDWVGGSSVDGLYSTAGMQFSLASSTGSPLKGKKSWFMFGDKIVALGTDISNTNNANVETIVDNRKLNGNGDNVLTVDGVAKSIHLGWSETMNGVQWAHLAGNVAGSDIGYYFPGGASLNGLRESRTGAWQDINPGQSPTPYSNNYLSLAFDHGANPTNASYAYAVLPNKSDADMATYASNPDISILENSADAQAVKDTTLNVVGVNFWNDVTKTLYANGSSFITSDKKASVTTLETANHLDVGVSDPTQSNEGTIHIEINRSATGAISLDTGITVTQFSPTIKMTVHVNGALGKTFNARFNFAPVTIPAAEDSYVRDGSYADNNFGTAATMPVKTSSTGYNRHAYLKFDLSTLMNSVANAKIQLIPTYKGQAEIANQANLVLDNSWSESGITWNNKPAASTLLGSWIVPAVGTNVQFDVTNQVNTALSADKLLSVQVSTPSNQGSNGDVSYATRENETAAYRPVMMLIPAAPTLNGATANNTEVTLNWPNVSGATGYKVKYGTASGSYTDTIYVTKVSGGTNSYTVTGLTNGTTYYFAVSATNAAGESADSNELSAVPIIQANQHVSITATGDTYVRDGSYADTNYGTAATTMVKTGSDGYNRYAFVKYDLSSITGTVSSAKIQLVPTTVGMTGITNQANLVSDNTWSESTLTWNNQPAASTLLSAWTVPAVGTYVEIDVTNQVIAALTVDKMLSIRISQPTDQGSAGYVYYATKENSTASYRPVLVIN